jgi:hypothetical protein
MSCLCGVKFGHSNAWVIIATRDRKAKHNGAFRLPEQARSLIRVMRMGWETWLMTGAFELLMRGCGSQLCPANRYLSSSLQVATLDLFVLDILLPL